MARMTLQERHDLMENNEYAPPWKEDAKRNRLHDCLVQLHLSGILTDREQERARKRLKKRYRKEKS